MMGKGALKVPIEDIYALGYVRAMFAVLASPKTVGELILKVG